MIARRRTSLLFIFLSVALVAACSGGPGVAPKSETPATATPSAAPQSETPATATPSEAPKPTAIEGAVGKRDQDFRRWERDRPVRPGAHARNAQFLGVKMTIKAKADIGLGRGSFVLLDRSKRAIGPNMPKFRPALSLPSVVLAGSSATGSITFLVDDGNKYRLRLTLGAEHPDVLVDLHDAVRTARGDTATPKPRSTPRPTPTKVEWWLKRRKARRSGLPERTAGTF